MNCMMNNFMNNGFLGMNSMANLYFNNMPTSFAVNIFSGYDMSWAKNAFQMPANNSLFGLSSPNQVIQMQMPKFMGPNDNIAGNNWNNFGLIAPDFNMWAMPDLSMMQMPLGVNSVNSPGLIPEIQNSKLFSAADKKQLAQLPKLTQQKTLELKQKAQEKGLDFEIESGYRSFEKQAMFKKAWDAQDQSILNKYGIIAKPAQAGHSWHNFGLALDITAKKGTFEQLGELAETLGWHWGGANDEVHIDLRNQANGETLASLRKKAGFPS